MNDRNYFDARSYYFQVLDRSQQELGQQCSGGPLPSGFAKYDQGRQAVVYPVVDHDYTFDEFAGGEVTVRSNITNLSRQTSDWLDFNANGMRDGRATILTRGPAGDLRALQHRS